MCEPKRMGGRVRAQAGPAPQDVPDGIDAHVQTGRAHHLHREGAPLDVGGGEGDAADAALRVRAEAREVHEAAVQPRRIHAPGAAGGLGNFGPGARRAPRRRRPRRSAPAAVRTKARRSMVGMAPSLLRRVAPGGRRARRRPRRRRDGSGGGRRGPARATPRTEGEDAGAAASPPREEGRTARRAPPRPRAEACGVTDEPRPSREEEDAAQGQAARRREPARAMPGRAEGPERAPAARARSCGRRSGPPPAADAAARGARSSSCPRRTTPQKSSTRARPGDAAGMDFHAAVAREVVLEEQLVEGVVEREGRAGGEEEPALPASFVDGQGGQRRAIPHGLADHVQEPAALSVDGPESAGDEERRGRGRGGQGRGHDLDVDVHRAARGLERAPARRAAAEAKPSRERSRRVTPPTRTRMRAGARRWPRAALQAGRRPIWMRGVATSPPEDPQPHPPPLPLPQPPGAGPRSAGAIAAAAARAAPRQQVASVAVPGTVRRANACARRCVTSQKCATIASGSPCSSSAAPAQLAQSEMRLQRRQTSLDCQVRARRRGKCSFQPSANVPAWRSNAVAARELAELERAVGVDGEGVAARPAGVDVIVAGAGLLGPRPAPRRRPA